MYTVCPVGWFTASAIPRHCHERGRRRNDGSARYLRVGDSTCTDPDVSASPAMQPQASSIVESLLLFIKARERSRIRKEANTYATRVRCRVCYVVCARNSLLCYYWPIDHYVDMLMSGRTLVLAFSTRSSETRQVLGIYMKRPSSTVTFLGCCRYLSGRAPHFDWGREAVSVRLGSIDNCWDKIGVVMAQALERNVSLQYFSLDVEDRHCAEQTRMAVAKAQV
jgi:hypothetical protein